MNIRVTADSTCDLSPEIRAQYGVITIPLTVLVGEESYHDGLNISPAQIIDAVENGKTCKTAAVNVYEYYELFRRASQGYDAVIHLCIGQKFSTCYANACLAAQEFPHVHVVDTASLSTGMGVMVLDAVDMARAGKTPEEIVAALEAERGLVDASFVLDQVEYLRNGGRCSAVAALGAKLLQLKPCIEVRDGVMGVGKKYRGSFTRSLEHYVQDKLGDLTHVDRRRVFLAHNLCAPEVVAHVKDCLEAMQAFEEILVTPAGGTICCHCGPNTLGVMFKRVQ